MNIEHLLHTLLIYIHDMHFLVSLLPQSLEVAVYPYVTDEGIEAERLCNLPNVRVETSYLRVCLHSPACHCLALWLSQ